MGNSPTRQINWRPLASVFADQISKHRISPHSINAFLVGTEDCQVRVTGANSRFLSSLTPSPLRMRLYQLISVGEWRPVCPSHLIGYRRSTATFPGPEIRIDSVLVSPDVDIFLFNWWDCMQGGKVRRNWPETRLPRRLHTRQPSASTVALSPELHWQTQSRNHYNKTDVGAIQMGINTWKYVLIREMDLPKNQIHNCEASVGRKSLIMSAWVLEYLSPR